MNKNIIIAAVAAVAVCCIGYVVGAAKPSQSTPAAAGTKSAPAMQCCPQPVAPRY